MAYFPVLTRTRRARATSAAPFFFKPFVHVSTGQTFLDGAMFHNNPINVASTEYELIWPDEPCEFPDIVLSVGTGTSHDLEKQGQGRLLEGKQYRTPSKLCLPRMIKIAKNHLAMALNCENIWDTFIHDKAKSRDQSGLQRFQRINPMLEGSVPKLDDVTQMIPIQSKVRETYGPGGEQSTRVREIALQLVATSFYFDLGRRTNRYAEGKIEAEGSQRPGTDHKVRADILSVSGEISGDSRVRYSTSERGRVELSAALRFQRSGESGKCAHQGVDAR